MKRKSVFGTIKELDRVQLTQAKTKANFTVKMLVKVDSAAIYT